MNGQSGMASPAPQNDDLNGSELISAAIPGLPVINAHGFTLLFWSHVTLFGCLFHLLLKVGCV